MARIGPVQLNSIAIQADSRQHIGKTSLARVMREPKQLEDLMRSVIKRARSMILRTHAIRDCTLERICQSQQYIELVQQRIEANRENAAKRGEATFE